MKKSVPGAIVGCLIAVLLPPLATAQTPTPVNYYSYKVSASADDAYETGSGAWTTTAALIARSYTVTSDNNYKAPGMRFQNVKLTSGMPIAEARIRVYVPEASGRDNANVVIYGNDVDNAANFTTESKVISRVRTTASKSWVKNSLGIGWKEMTGLEGIVSEIIGRPGWSSGSAVAILFIPNSDQDRELRFYSYDTDPGGLAPELIIERQLTPSPTPVGYKTVTPTPFGFHSPSPTATASPSPTATSSPSPAPETHFVSQTGSDTYPYTTWETAAWLIQSAIDAAWTSGTVVIAADTYYLGLVDLNKSLTIAGADPANRPWVCLSTNRSVWFDIDGPYTVNIRNLILDGAGNGKLVNIAIRMQGGAAGTIENNIIRNIYQSIYVGTGVYLMNDAVVQDNVFENIERMGVAALVDTTYNCRIRNNTYRGKADPDHVDYGIIVAYGGKATIEDNTVYYCNGRPQGWGSVGIGVTSSGWIEGYGQSAAVVQGNELYENHIGLGVGSQIEGDFSAVTATGNEFHNNNYAISVDRASPPRIYDNNIYDNYYYGVKSWHGTIAYAAGNWWGDGSGPYDPDGTVECQSSPCWNCQTCDLNLDGLGDRVTDDVVYCPWKLQELPATPTPVGYHTPAPSPTPEGYPSATPTPSASAPPTPQPTLTPMG